jgi:hypothetical protein
MRTLLAVSLGREQTLGINRRFPLSFIEEVKFHEIGKSITISVSSEFKTADITYIISEINSLIIQIPTTEYFEEKKHIILKKLGSDNRYSIIGKTPYSTIPVGALLTLDFSLLSLLVERALDDELREVARDKDDSYVIEHSFPGMPSEPYDPPLLNN